MADIALFGRDHMIQSLALRQDRVMAGGTSRSGFSMVKRFRGLPCARRNIMAFFTIVARAQTADVFPSHAVDISKRAAVATDAAGGQSRVIHFRAQPSGDGVAAFARECGWDMQRRAHAACRNAVMARGAGPQCLCVVELQRVLKGCG